MTSHSAAAVRSFRVGPYIATLTIPPAQPGSPRSAVIEWHPHLPASLTPAQLDQYRRGRNMALREMSAELGLNTMVVEL